MRTRRTARCLAPTSWPAAGRHALMHVNGIEMCLSHRHSPFMKAVWDAQPL